MKTTYRFILLLLFLACVGQGYLLYRERDYIFPKYLTWAVGGREAALPAVSARADERSQPDDLFLDFEDDPWLWDPFQEMKRMQERMDRIFERAFKRFARSPKFGALIEGGAAVPSLDLSEDDQNFYVKIDVPGAEKSRIQVDLEGEALLIRGRRSGAHEEQDPKRGYLRKERWVGEFERRLVLPGKVDKNKELQTSYRDGVLTVTVPKAQ